MEYCGSNESNFFVNDGVELKSVRDATRFVGLLKNSKLEKKNGKEFKKSNNNNLYSFALINDYLNAVNFKHYY